MRTTLNVDDELLRAAKRAAVEQETTLTRVVEEALRRYLEPPARREPFELDLLVKRSRVQPGVTLADRDSLYEAMEGRS